MMYEYGYKIHFSSGWNRRPEFAGSGENFKLFVKISGNLISEDQQNQLKSALRELRKEVDHKHFNLDFGDALKSTNDLYDLALFLHARLQKKIAGSELAISSLHLNMGDLESVQLNQ